MKILRNAVSKTYNRICDLRKEISSQQKNIASAAEVAAKAKAELDEAELKLTLVDGEPVVGDNPVKLKRLKSSSEKANEEEVSARESLEAKEALLARALDEIEVPTRDKLEAVSSIFVYLIEYCPVGLYQNVLVRLFMFCSIYVLLIFPLLSLYLYIVFKNQINFPFSSSPLISFLF